uniref:Uncharacterized protein n=1 Tax=Trypanosoma vivax (strain Y486) TaxID=1055687 RepID=G0TVE7_TRYVY|nr:conserved hypothetical protein [Trypanosoma vivax Y486]
MWHRFPLLKEAQLPSRARVRLLTYPMALSQPNATVPLVQRCAKVRQRNPENQVDSSNALSHLSCSVKVRATPTASQYEREFRRGTHLSYPYRWLRQPDELCVAQLRRCRDVNRINSYVVTYKFDDPQWTPFLLPEVTLRRGGGGETPSQSVEGEGHGSGGGGSGSSSCRQCDKNCVHINHNKLITLECMARHANYSLRHIVQKGHGVYLIHHAQHSILQPKGVIEQSFVTCSFGIRGERLRTDIVHVGPIYSEDILDVRLNDPGTHVRCCFDFQRQGVRRGVVAVSQVEGYGTWFQRKPMLWQRSRRIGALQSQLGAFAYDLAAPGEVGKRHDYEVSLLAPHMKFFNEGMSGAEAIGVIASSQVAQNERLYLGEFEAPAITALDAVHQLSHALALRCKLVAPFNLKGEHLSGVVPDSTGEVKGNALREPDEMETLLPLSWATRTPPPYVPLESDLPFKLQMSRPSVITCERESYALPTGGTVGSPFVHGAPLVMFEYNVHQGVDHYVFDDAPSARPMKWWSQKSNLPYSGYMYFVRSNQLHRVVPSEEIPNPLEPASSRVPLHRIVPPTKVVQQRLRRYKRRLQERGVKQGSKGDGGASSANKEGC